MFTYQALLGEIEETTALRRILPEESEILAATEDRERGARASLAVTPEHVEAQAAWRALGEWFRGQLRPKRHTAPAPLPTTRTADELGLFFVSLPPLSIA